MKKLSETQIKWILRGLSIVVVLTGLCFLFFFIPSGMEKSKRFSPDQGPLTTKKPAPAEPEAQSVTVEKMEDFLLALKETTQGHDPFLSSGEQEWKHFLTEFKAQPPRLQGIIQVEGKKAAIIQSARFYEGDEVKGFRVFKIEDKEVLLTKEGKTYTLTINTKR